MVHLVRGLYTIMICMVLFNVYSRVGRKLYTVLGLGLGRGYIQFHKHRVKWLVGSGKNTHRLLILKWPIALI